MKLDLVGKSFGYLTVLRESDTKKNNKRSWVVKCICGKEKVVYTSQLRSKNIKSCGCRGGDWSKAGNGSRKEPGVAAINNYYSDYKFNAKNKKIFFNLTIDEFKDLIFNSCYYCGEEPNKYFHPPKANGGIYCNGVDRKDNKKGYEINNCVSCCSKCNYFKNKLSEEQFLKLIEKIYNNRIRILQSTI